MVGKWLPSTQAITVSVPLNAKHCVALMLFSGGCAKWFEITEVDVTAPALVVRNCDGVQHKYQVLESGHTYLICAKYCEQPCPPTSSLERISTTWHGYGHSEYSEEDIITYHEFRIEANNNTESFGVTLIIVDDIVGPHVP